MLRYKKMRLITEGKPNHKELKNLFERSFSEILHDDTGYFQGDLDQDQLSDWFDFDEMIKYLPYGKLIEARDDDNILVGAGFIAKQSPMTWPDGHKAELFIIGIVPGTQNRGLGSAILAKCEEEAKKFDTKAVVINAHSMQPQLHKFYEKNGYKRIGELQNYYANGNAMFFTKNL